MSERSELLPSPSQEPTHNVRHAEEEQVTTISALRGFIIGIAVLVLLFILTFGVSVITTIQSSIARDLEVTSGVSWFVASYLIASTTITPIIGTLCVIFSPKSCLFVSTFIQIVGLLITALAQSLQGFLIGRAVSGIGAAAITPIAFILVTRLSSRRRWGLLFGILNCGYTLGIAMGAVVGGELQPRIGWRAVFWTQAPVCLIASTVAFLAIPKEPSTAAERYGDTSAVSQMLARIDYLGLVTLIISLVLLLVSLSAQPLQLTPLLLSIGMFIVFGLVESRWAVEPIIPPALLQSRAVLLTGIATIGYMCARWEVLFYMPTYGIAVRGWSQTRAGSLLVPTNFGFGLGSVVVGTLSVRRAGSYYFGCVACFALYIVVHFLLSRLVQPNSSLWLLMIGLFADGFVGGAILTYNLPHLLHLTRPSLHVIVIPLNAMFRGLSGSVGSSLAGGVFSRSLQNSLVKGFEEKGMHGRGELIMQLLSRPMLVQQLEGAEREVAEQSYASSIRYLYVIGCTWVMAMLVIQAGTGWTAPDEVPSKQKDRMSSVDEAVQ